MTKQNSTLIVMVLDRSGSMESCKKGTIEGFNAFIDSQKESQRQLNDEVKVSLIQFDSLYEINYTMLPLENVPKLNEANYKPRGGTALYDAIGKTVVDVGAALRDTVEHERPSKVLVVVLTDGEENESKRYGRSAIFDMIRHQENKYGWEFVYIGANQDSFAVGGSLGVKTSNIANYVSSNVGTKSMYSSLDGMTKGYRSSGKVGFDQQP